MSDKHCRTTDQSVKTFFSSLAESEVSDAFDAGRPSPHDQMCYHSSLLHLRTSPVTLLPPAALASALNKTGAFAKTSITPASASGAGSPSDLLAMTARLKGLSPFFTCNLAYSPLSGAISYGLPELMDPANPNCLPPPPAEGSGGAPVPSDDDMLNVAQVRSASQ